MKKEQITPVVRSGAAFGYETGFSQAVSYFRETAAKLDGDPEMKTLALSVVASIEEFGRADKVKFVNSLEFEISGDFVIFS